MIPSLMSLVFALMLALLRATSFMSDGRKPSRHDPFFSDPEVFGRKLDAYEIAVEVHARDASGSRPHAVVQHGLALLSVSPHQVLHERHGLLCRMPVPLSLDGKVDDPLRVV
jgi:hypothetical protein